MHKTCVCAYVIAAYLRLHHHYLLLLFLPTYNNIYYSYFISIYINSNKIKFAKTNLLEENLNIEITHLRKEKKNNETWI